MTTPNPYIAHSRLVDRQIDEVIGLAKGIMADGCVTQQEAEFLLEWLETNRHAANKWPANILYQRLKLALQDGVLDSDEEKELLILLADITGKPKLDSTHSMTTTLPICDPAPKVTFSNKTFCLTGTFISGKRSEASEQITMRGGCCKTNPTKKTDYLVIGDTGSTDWIHSTFGRKIEKAIELQKDGHPIAIISEQHWLSSL